MEKFFRKTSRKINNGALAIGQIADEDVNSIIAFLRSNDRSLLPMQLPTNLANPHSLQNLSAL